MSEKYRAKVSPAVKNALFVSSKIPPKVSVVKKLKMKASDREFRALSESLFLVFLRPKISGQIENKRGRIIMVAAVYAYTLVNITHINLDVPYWSSETNDIRADRVFITRLGNENTSKIRNVTILMSYDIVWLWHILKLTSLMTIKSLSSTNTVQCSWKWFNHRSFRFFPSE